MFSGCHTNKNIGFSYRGEQNVNKHVIPSL